MTYRFKLNLPRLILAIALMVIGVLSIITFTRTELILLRSNFTSIATILGGIIFYAGVVIIIMMFESETILSITLLIPSIAAMAIFVYGFIGWSVRVSLSKWKGLNPDFTWVGLAQYDKTIPGSPFSD